MAFIIAFNLIHIHVYIYIYITLIINRMTDSSLDKHEHIYDYIQLLQFKTNKNKTCSAMLPIKSSTQFVHATSQTIFFSLAKC